jgi:hypothetical protein
MTGAMPGPSPAALDRLVLVVGPTRGGTSMVHAALGAHPGLLVIPAELHFLDHVWRYRRRIHDRLWRVIAFLPSAIDRRAVFDALDPDARRRLASAIEATLAAKRFGDLYRLYPRLYAQMPGQPKPPGSLAAWADKVNDWRGLGTVRRRMGGARFVVVARDPRAVALSHARRARVWQGDGEAPLDKGDLARAALYWRLFMQRCLAFAAAGRGDTIVVRYEDVVAEPAATLNRAFAHARLDALSATAIETALAGLRGGATNTPELYQGVSTAPAERWRAALTPDQAALVEALTAPTARKLGYPMADRAAPSLALPLAARRALATLAEPWSPAPR